MAADHYDFESIHPFFDGNGRVDRLIMITQLLSKDYPPAIIQIEGREIPTIWRWLRAIWEIIEILFRWFARAY